MVRPSFRPREQHPHGPRVRIDGHVGNGGPRIGNVVTSLVRASIRVTEFASPSASHAASAPKTRRFSSSPTRTVPRTSKVCASTTVTVPTAASRIHTAPPPAAIWSRLPGRVVEAVTSPDPGLKAVSSLLSLSVTQTASSSAASPLDPWIGISRLISFVVGSIR